MGIIYSYIKLVGRLAGNDLEKNIMSLLPKGDDLVYLDCGCDNGEKTISRAGHIGTDRIFGIELIKKRAKLAVKRGVKVSNFNLNEKWEYLDKQFDIITATEVVEHLVDLDNFFLEARRVLKKDGILIVSTENLASFHNIFALILGNQPSTGPYLSRLFSIGYHPCNCYQKDKERILMPPHLNVMTKKALASLFNFFRFKILSIKGSGFYPFPPPLAQIFSFFAKNYASYVVVKGVKIDD
jgi:2-polyprenyl-3-methyl-5-hydroxy-6-metoxy-1,4-benzoquinol methylase